MNINKLIDDCYFDQEDFKSIIPFLNKIKNLSYHEKFFKNFDLNYNDSSTKEGFHEELFKVLLVESTIRKVWIMNKNKVSLSSYSSIALFPYLKKEPEEILIKMEMDADKDCFEHLKEIFEVSKGKNSKKMILIAKKLEQLY